MSSVNDKDEMYYLRLDINKTLSIEETKTLLIRWKKCLEQQYNHTSLWNQWYIWKETFWLKRSYLQFLLRRITMQTTQTSANNTDELLFLKQPFESLTNIQMAASIYLFISLRLENVLNHFEKIKWFELIQQVEPNNFHNSIINELKSFKNKRIQTTNAERKYTWF
jgi:hypothetical protein